MIFGIPKEIKNNENRVSITPSGVSALTKLGKKVIIETNAGFGSGFLDSDYEQAGATIANAALDVWTAADIIIKVKEPLSSEYELLKNSQTLFTYLHLAPNPELTDVLIKKKITAIAYETVQLENKSLPLLAPMSEVAGRMSIQVGATLLQKYYGGSGVLLGGVPGVAPADVLIIGGGVVGANAAKMAIGLGARVTIFDISKSRLSWLDDTFGGRLTTLIFNDYDLASEIKKADLVIAAVLVAGAKAPKIVSEDMVKSMKKGSVIVDVAIDQGGSVATIDRVTTHDNPCYEKHGIIHYSVANIPGAVPRTSTLALTSVTLPYILEIAKKGISSALSENSSLKSGLNIYNGVVTNLAVAESQNLQYNSVDKFF
ncbi:MAG: alanine dehydrogenase [Pseudomonadota bacterium]|jgi:alanine dehydrogenase